MRRIQLAEIHDQPWFPKLLRDFVTDSLQSVFRLGNLYAPIIPRLRKALQQTGTERVVDLCSGAAGPWFWLHRAFDRQGETPLQICLTDKYPNAEAFERARIDSNGSIQFYKDPVDAAAIPAELKGFRTLFTSFHHFGPREARSILQDAVDQGEGIGVFEVPQRHLLTIFLVFLVPIAALLLAPFLRPFRWSRLFWTYLLPVVPIVLYVDGVISCMRTYSPAELSRLTAELSASGYHWEAGKEPGRLIPISITYLVGYPAR